MTVKELIDELKKHDGDLVVWAILPRGSFGFDCAPVIGVDSDGDVTKGDCNLIANSK